MEKKIRKIIMNFFKIGVNSWIEDFIGLNINQKFPKNDYLYIILGKQFPSSNLCLIKNKCEIHDKNRLRY